MESVQRCLTTIVSILRAVIAFFWSYVFQEDPEERRIKEAKNLIKKEILDTIGPERFRLLGGERRLLPLFMMYEGQVGEDLCVLISHTLVKPRLEKKNPSNERRFKAVWRLIALMKRAHRDYFSKKPLGENWADEAHTLASTTVQKVLRGKKGRPH